MDGWIEQTANFPKPPSNDYVKEWTYPIPLTQISKILSFISCGSTYYTGTMSIQRYPSYISNTSLKMRQGTEGASDQTTWVTVYGY